MYFIFIWKFRYFEHELFSMTNMQWFDSSFEWKEWSSNLMKISLSLFILFKSHFIDVVLWKIF